MTEKPQKMRPESRVTIGMATRWLAQPREIGFDVAGLCHVASIEELHSDPGYSLQPPNPSGPMAELCSFSYATVVITHLEETMAC